MGYEKDAMRMMRRDGRVCVFEDGGSTGYIYYAGRDAGFRVAYETRSGDWRGPGSLGGWELTRVFDENVVYCRDRDEVPGVVAALSRSAEG